MSRNTPWRATPPPALALGLLALVTLAAWFGPRLLHRSDSTLRHATPTAVRESCLAATRDELPHVQPRAEEATKEPVFDAKQNAWVLLLNPRYLVYDEVYDARVECTVTGTESVLRARVKVKRL